MRIRPSKLSLTTACPGSVRMQLENPWVGPESEYARKGTATHWAAERTLRGEQVATGEVAPNGHIVAPDMLACAEYYAGVVRQQADVHEVHIESEVACTRVGPEGTKGTCDAWAWCPGDMTLRVCDMKSG